MANDPTVKDVMQIVNGQPISLSKFIADRVATLEAKCTSATKVKEGFIKIVDSLIPAYDAAISTYGLKLLLDDIAEELENVPKPANAKPLDICEGGNAGESLKYAREDHQHPIPSSLKNEYQPGKMYKDPTVVIYNGKLWYTSGSEYVVVPGDNDDEIWKLVANTDDNVDIAIGNAIDLAPENLNVGGLFITYPG